MCVKVYSVSQWQWWSANRLLASLLHPCGLALFFKRPLTIPPYKPTQLVCRTYTWENEEEHEQIFLFWWDCSLCGKILALYLLPSHCVCLMDFIFNTQRMHSFSSISTTLSKLLLFIPRRLSFLFLICQICAEKKKIPFLPDGHVQMPVLSFWNSTGFTRNSTSNVIKEWEKKWKAEKKKRRLSCARESF